MDRHLKERLVGAAVLVAAATILIPEMLSGPKDAAPVPAELPAQAADANGVKTYTIDLAAPKAPVAEQAPTSSPGFVETVAPPPEALAQALVTEATPQPVAPQQATPQPNIPAVTSREQRAPEESMAQGHSADKKPAEKAPVAETPPLKPASDDAHAGAWAVQVASFGARATSDRIAAELKSKGYPAFVMSIAVKGQTMYRVRVGPVADRAAAEALLKKIKPLHPNATLAAP